MTTEIIQGATTWSMTRDQDGHRDYKIIFRLTGSVDDGPANVLSTPGLPVPGDVWNWDADRDDWAFCRQPATVTPDLKGEPNTEWTVEFTYSTKSDDKRCKDQQIEDPLSVAPRISGSFQKYQEEATTDRFGVGITNSAWEQFRGSQVEFDKNRPSVKIEMNIPSFITIVLAYQMLDHVNAFPLWGFKERCIKLSNAPWEVKYYGQCYKYYVLTLEFDIRDDTFDRDLLDEGTKVLHGHWDTVGNWIIDKVGGIDPPLKPTLSRSVDPAGLAAGNYSYRISAVNAQGETTAGPEATIVCAAANNQINIKWAPVVGANGYNIYGRTAGTELKLATRELPEYSDSGLDVPGGALPIANTTGIKDADPNNPSHFDHAKDRNGENMRIVLNGAGLPSGVTTSISTNYISYYALNHQGQPVTDLAFWKPIVGSYKPIPEWNQANHYVTGNLVVLNDPTGDGPFVWIALQAAFDITQAPGNATYWLKVGSVLDGPPGIQRTTLHFEGLWKETDSYEQGAIVIIPNDVGKINVQKYDSADFVLLGIPLSF